MALPIAPLTPEQEAAARQQAAAFAAGMPPPDPGMPPPAPIGPPPDAGVPMPAREALEADAAARERAMSAGNTINATSTDAAGKPTNPVIPGGAVALAPQEQGAGSVQTTMPAQAPPQPGFIGGAQSFGGGTMPAHEVALVGPTGLKALQAQNRADEQYGGEQMRRSQNIADAYNAAGVAHEGLGQHEEAYRNEIGRIQAEKERRLSELHDEIAKDGAELAEMKIDPNRRYAEVGTGGRLAIMLGAGLSGAFDAVQAHAFGGGPPQGNSFLKRIDAEIDRDVQAQRDNYNAKAKSIEAKRSLYGQLVEKYGDQEKAAAVLRQSHYNTAENLVKAAMASAKSDEAIMTGNTLIHDLKTAENTRLLHSVQQVQAQSSPGKQLAPFDDGRGHVFWLPPEKGLELGYKYAELANKAGEHGAKELSNNRALAVHLPSGEIRMANDPEQRKIGDKRAIAYKQIDDAFKEAERLRGEIETNAASNPIKANAARLQLQRLGLTTAKTVEAAQEQGVLREGEVPAALNLTTGFTAMQPGSGESLQRGRKMFDQQFHTMSGILFPHKAAMRVENGVPVYTVVPSEQQPNGPPPGATRR